MVQRVKDGCCAVRAKPRIPAALTELWKEPSAGLFQLALFVLACADCLKSRPVGDPQSGALQRHKLPVLKLTERPRNGFSCRTDELGNLFVGERQLDLRALLGVLRLRGPVQEQAGYLLRRRS